MRRAAEWLAMVGLLVCCGCGWYASAQEPVLLPTVTAVAAGGIETTTTVGGALRSLASRAGLVFVGQVAKIERRSGVVEITFNVDQVVMGSAGVSYTLREWSGLWVASDPYHLGERALVFLPPVMGTGYGVSSPVNGAVGVIPLVPMGADAPLLDVRWLASRLQRSQGKPMVGEAVSLSDAVSVVSQWKAKGIEPSLRRLPVGWKPAPVELPGRMVSLGVSNAAR
jgi:hypothetical protein